MLVSQPENRRYISGFDGSAGYLLVTQDDAILATDFRYTEQAEKQAAGFEVFQTNESTEKWLPGLIKRLKIKKLSFEAKDIQFALYKKIADALPKTKLLPVEDIVENIRIVKEKNEIELIKKAAVISDGAIKHSATILKEGITELELAWEIEKFMRENGSQTLPFEVIVASGANAAMPHAQPSGKGIKNGETVVIDIGAKVGGYASDITRTLCAGKPDKKFKEIYDTVLKAQQAAIDGITTGMACAQADSLARDAIAKAGYGNKFGHSLGHGIGLNVHEKPFISQKSQDLLKNDMIFTVEPGIYIPGWGGVRIEDDVWLKNGRIEVLTKAEK